MHFSSALALARRPWPWPAGPSLGYASAEASGPWPGPWPGPLGLGRCLRKAFFSAHFSKAGILILETQKINSWHHYIDNGKILFHFVQVLGLMHGFKFQELCINLSKRA